MLVVPSVLSLKSGYDRDALHDRYAKQTADPSTPLRSDRDDELFQIILETGH
jgi:hypothetical protein